MSLSNQHLVRNTSERKVGKSGQNKASCQLQFNRADALLQEVVADIVNGFTRNDIIMKFSVKGYDSQKKAIKESQAKEYIRMAYLVLQDDRVEEQDKLRDQLYNQYMMLYNESVLNGNTIVAKQVLDSIAKTFVNTDRKDITLSVDKNSDNISISFGFDNNQDNE